MRNRRVVVTGLGAVTPIGNTVSEFWEGLINGKNGVGPITRFNTEGFDTKFAAEVKGFDISQFVDPKEARRMDIFTHYGMVAGHQAIRDSGLDLSQEDSTRIGVIVSSGIGGMVVYDTEHRKLIEKGPKRVSPFFIPMMILDIVSGRLSIQYGLKGPNYATVSACASSSHGIGAAMMHIERGDADVMIAGGTEGVITPMAFAGFNSMKALSERNDDPIHASRPFDKERDGFVMGEGAGIVILEELSHARKRGAKIYAELAGIGFTGDAYHITAPQETGEGAINVMRAAVRNAEINFEEVGYINAHGTSTPLNDKTETLAIKAVFGEHAKKLCVSSNKSMIGHLLGASGAVECVATILTITNGVVPPTINYQIPDSECDLDYVPNTARQRKVNAAISNSFGFGGHNACLCLKAFNG
jgi:3-oxoacyl-[acyl-carrier-protein] synthase II